MHFAEHEYNKRSERYTLNIIVMNTKYCMCTRSFASLNHLLQDSKNNMNNIYVSSHKQQHKPGALTGVVFTALVSF